MIVNQIVIFSPPVPLPLLLRLSRAGQGAWPRFVLAERICKLQLRSYCPFMTAAIASAIIRSHINPAASISVRCPVVPSACRFPGLKSAAVVRRSCLIRHLLPPACSRLQVTAISSTAAGECGLPCNLGRMPVSGLTCSTSLPQHHCYHTVFNQQPFRESQLYLKLFLRPPQALQFLKSRQAACPQKYHPLPCLEPRR